MPTPSSSEYRTIPLTKGQVALVDAVDYESLSQWKWFARWSKPMQSYYAMRSDYSEGHKTIYMHRQILELGFRDKRRGDHREPSRTLDNRRANLRISSPAQNGANSRIRRDTRSGLKGVSYNDAKCNRSKNKWHARITKNGCTIWLGRFATAEVAHEAYCEAAKRLSGEFARAS